MAHLTDNFTSEGPLTETVLAAIKAAFEQGWADPKKLSQASHKAQALRSAALSQIADSLTVAPEAIEVLGEPNLAHQLALQGFLTGSNALCTSQIDVGKIRAVGRGYAGAQSTLEVDSNGVIARPLGLTPEDVISVQAENGETGISQDLEPWRSLASTLVLDATHTIPKPSLTDGFAAATFDAQSWGGPSGLSLLLINDAARFRYPLPHIAPIRVPGSYSLPLLVGAAVALKEYQVHERRIHKLRTDLASQLKEISGVKVIGECALPTRYLSLLVDGISGEEVLRSLLQQGISTDSGSACSPEDLTPSHVIAAMGYQTTGHMRMTIHTSTTHDDVKRLATVFGEVVGKLRS